MIVCVTGPLVAAALSNDSDHKACVELFTALHAARRAIAERLGLTDVATLDRRHFTVVRPRHVDALTLLP